MADTVRTKLFRAIYKSDIKMLRAVLKQGVSLAFEDGDHMPVMHEAVNYGHDDIEILDELLAHGADVNLPWNTKGSPLSSGDAPLHWVVCSGRPEVLKWFLRHGANVNAVNGSGLTPFNNCIKTFGMLPDEEKDEAGFLKGDMKTLIDAGADIFLADSAGNSPLHWASLFGLTKTARFLLERGAAIDAQDSEGRTPLRLAVQAESYEIVEMLLGKGADPNMADNTQRSPMHWIADENSHELDENERRIVDLLIRSGANLDAPSKINHSPLCCAAMANNISVADILISRGASLDFNDGEALRNAVFFEYGGFVLKLLAAGANPDLQDPETLDGSVHVAASERYPEGLKILHQYKANLELLNIDGETPLCVAARRQADDAVKYLIDSGANVNHVDSYGNTPLFWARRTGNKEMEEMLLAAGVKTESAV